MPLYILHYATIDAEGHLSIDCQGPFPTKEAARKQQTTLITAFQATSHPPIELISSSNDFNSDMSCSKGGYSP